MRALLDSGVNVGLGVDGSASNDSGNLLHEARLACFLQRAAGDVSGKALSARLGALLTKCYELRGVAPDNIRKVMLVTPAQITSLSAAEQPRERDKSEE